MTGWPRPARPAPTGRDSPGPSSVRAPGQGRAPAARPSGHEQGRDLVQRSSARLNGPATAARSRPRPRPGGRRASRRAGARSAATTGGRQAQHVDPSDRGSRPHPQPPAQLGADAAAPERRLDRDRELGRGRQSASDRLQLATARRTPSTREASTRERGRSRRRSRRGTGPRPWARRSGWRSSAERRRKGPGNKSRSPGARRRMTRPPAARGPFPARARLASGRGGEVRDVGAVQPRSAFQLASETSRARRAPCGTRAGGAGRARRA